jgi:hypothetical protein
VNLQDKRGGTGPAAKLNPDPPKKTNPQPKVKGFARVIIPQP